LPKNESKAPSASDRFQTRSAEIDRKHEKRRQALINRGRVQVPFSDAQERLTELFEHQVARRDKRAKLGAELPVDTHYFRLRVRNTGRGRAEMVEVFALELTRQQENGSFRKVDKFLPQNLLWTHINQTHYPVLSRGMEKNCDLGFIQDPARRSAEDSRLLGIGNREASFDFSLQVPTFTLNHVITAGTYRLSLAVAAANSKTPVLFTLEMVFSGNWFDDHQQMRERAIQVRLL
jgi:hypothetical protein